MVSKPRVIVMEIAELRMAIGNTFYLPLPLPNAFPHACLMPPIDAQ
jgi:hypothetical protein